MEEKKNVQAENIPKDVSETLCPGCGKFVGAYERCPYCGTELKKRMSIVFFKRTALIVAIGGLFLLWLTATKMKAPLVKIGEITNNYNNAVIEIEGKVVSTRPMGDDGISFMVEDGTGKIKCQTFRDMGKMKEKGNLPHAGDEVSVVGQLQITDRWGSSLMINVVSNVKVTPAKSEKVTIGDITAEDKNQLVEVVGEIVSASHNRGNIFLRVGDATGLIDVPLWKKELNRMKDEKHKEEISTVGKEIRVVGNVDEFRGKPQIQVRDIEEIEVLDKDTIPTKKIPKWEGARPLDEKKLEKIKIGNITLGDEGKLVEVRGEVVKAWPGEKKTDLLIGDATGTIKIPLWNSEMKKLKEAKREEITTPGNELKITGIVGQWKGKLQLKVSDFATIEVLSDDVIPTESIPGWKKKQEEVLKKMSPAMRQAEKEQEETPVTTY